MTSTTGPVEVELDGELPARLHAPGQSLVKLGLATLDTMRTIDLTRATDLGPLDGRAHAVLDGVHLLDWFDDTLGAACGVAASAAPVVAAFPAVVPAR